MSIYDVPTNSVGYNDGTHRRIDSACFVEGAEDEFITEFFAMSGSILRRVYNRRSTVETVTFVPVDSWQYAELRKMA